MRKLLLSIVIFSIVFQLNAQRRQGSWQDYLSFSNATKIAVAGSKIYCATEGGLFYYDRDDNSIQKFSGVNGLTDFGIQTIAWNENSEVLVVAYKNSNIDLITESGVVNLSDIKRKQITGDKNIYNISFSEDEAYLSCGFGVVVLNLARQEVKDTYFIGEGGAMIQVNDVEVFEQNIYAATNEGLLKADLTNPNLLDYRSWNKVENIPNFNGRFTHLAVHASVLLANYTPENVNHSEFYRFNGEDWQRYLHGVYFADDVMVNQGMLTLSGRSEFYVIDENLSVAARVNSYRLSGEEVSPIRPRSVGVAQDGSYWVADYENGLIKIASENHESVFPNGPMDNRIFSLYTNDGDLWVTPGGRSDSWSNIWQTPRFQLFREGQWNYFTPKDYPELDGFYDIVDIKANPANPDHIFVASWGGGLLEFENGQLVNRFTNQNSPLETALPNNPSQPYVRIGGIDFDSERNLWMTNSEVAKNLVKLTPSGEWESITLPEVANNFNIGQVLVTDNDDKWILVPRGHDAYVVDKSGTQKKRLLVTSYFNNGVFEEFKRMNDVYCIAEDLDGAIWIGTSVGVAVYNNPNRIWDTEDFYAIRPSLDLNDGLFHPLLETETVTAIAVDGANRKWLGTRNSGVYLVSENGENEIMHFTTENSPLFSNNIMDIAINQVSGEVFIGTSEGLISYQGDAIAGKKAYANVYVYPNPVRETYDGPVTITGLVEDTDVKITDISGNLVYQGTSLGGQAVWDGKNLNGNRVKTGVYLVFCNDEYGEETHIEKLLFIN
ncbi:Por secretion system C-terminal sorting domain-containing protein [Tangfeifania diversioriginum]|uniref:Por secretion system C-terminal sorting domain-containing protein n=1 Tax=Tangfeifania diversioriginum TaxID=1168035 RepID=A0A1M6IAE1_9BACT|nr:T9SS type A sorting domain-containing protein [Tangfeifania diversioriginum]SHJ31441.1 Por secretion system C-terminal sorting domain-containing protein [Tangfeifania diversioriginum]